MVGMPVKIELLKWALDRADKQVGGFKDAQKLAQVLKGEKNFTMRQLQSFADYTHTAIGFFFLPEPPKIDLPIPDFRTIGNQGVPKPSTHLIEMVHRCQRRQAWFRNYANTNRLPQHSYVGTKTVGAPIEQTAHEIRKFFDVETRERQNKETDVAFRMLRHCLDKRSVLVMASGVVDYSTRRRLEVEEFRGFALVDEMAPLIFINNSDSPAARNFTLMHELAHLYLGETGLSSVMPSPNDQHQQERWCNKIAGAILVPKHEILSMVPRNPNDFDWDASKYELAKHFTVSTLVILFRLRDLSYLTEAFVWQCYRQEAKVPKPKRNDDEAFRLSSINRQKGMTGRIFTEAVVYSAREGRLSYLDASKLFGLKKTSPIDKLYHQLKSR